MQNQNGATYSSRSNTFNMQLIRDENPSAYGDVTVKVKRCHTSLEEFSRGAHLPLVSH